MPLYDIRCVTCGKTDSVYRRVAEYNDLPECCGVKMERVLSAPTVIADIQPYKSMATGEMIDSRTKHKRHLKAHGLAEIGDQHESHQRQLEANKAAEKKKQSAALRQEIAARLDSIT